MNKLFFASVPRILLLCLSIIILDSCKPKRDITPVSDVLKRSPQSLVASMHSNHADFDFLSTRFSGNAVIDNQNYNLSGNIRIQKDEAIFISIAPILGIEVARVLITPDTVKILNRLESSYFIGDMQYINRMLNADLDFYMLQAILIGNDFDHFNGSNFQVMEDRGRLMLHSPSRGRNRGTDTNPWQHNLWLDATTFRIEQTMLYDPIEQRTIHAAYSNFSSIGGQQFPTQLTLEFIEPSAKAEISLRYNRTDLNNPRELTFSIPERYVPMDF